MLGRLIECLGTIAVVASFPSAAGRVLADGPPYPPSPVIAGITWHWETHRSAASGSDLWPVTWGPDGHVYTAWGDGGGFGGTNSDARVSMGFARIEGPPESFRAVNDYAGADRSWAWGAGAGGSYILWNSRIGIVLAGFGIDTRPTSNGIPHAIESCIKGDNPLSK